MYNHEPPDYECPFCRNLRGIESELNTARDIVCRTERAAAMISPHWWPKNPGHVLVVPTAHHESLYDLPAADGHAVHDLVKDIAIAMRSSYGCDGISTRQHNEPAGYQDVWHYHVHVFPRYHGDRLYAEPKRLDPVPGERRWRYADRLRAALNRPAPSELGVDVTTSKRPGHHP